MPRPRFGSVGQESEILGRIRTMREAGSTLAGIAEALREAGFVTRAGTNHSVATVSRILIECDDVHRTVQDLSKQAALLSTTISKFRMLAAKDASCARINAQVQTLQEGGLPQVEAIAQAVGVA